MVTNVGCLDSGSAYAAAGPVTSTASSAGRRLPLFIGVAAALGALTQLPQPAFDPGRPVAIPTVAAAATPATVGIGSSMGTDRGHSRAVEAARALSSAAGGTDDTFTIGVDPATWSGNGAFEGGVRRVAWSPASDTLLSWAALRTATSASIATATASVDGVRAEPPVQMASLRPALMDRGGDGRPAVSAPLASGAVQNRAGDPDARLDGVRRQRLIDYISRWYRVAPEDVDRYLADAVGAAREYRLDPMLVIGVMAVESSFNPKAQSSVGAQGLMQVHTRVHKDKFRRHGGATAAYDPRANVRVGAQILSGYLQRYGSTEGALKAYVGAAFMRHDGGYGRKVTGMRDTFAAVADGRLGLKASQKVAMSGAASPAGPSKPHGGTAAVTGRTVTASAASRVQPASHAQASDRALRRLAQDATARSKARLVAQQEAPKRRM